MQNPSGVADTTFIDPSPRLVYRHSMRLRLGSLFLMIVVAAGCKHQQTPPVENPKPSPSPMGDLLRFKANAGDEPKARVTLLIEQEMTARNGEKNGGRKLILSFTLMEEEKVDAVAP